MYMNSGKLVTYTIKNGYDWFNRYTAAYAPFRNSTLDNSLTNVLFGTVYNPATCMHAFPRNFVGRIYTDGGSLGTGFIYYSPTGIPYVISAKHVATNPLSINLRYFICFDYDQYFSMYTKEIDLINHRLHVCRQNLFEIIPLAINFSPSLRQRTR